MTLTPNPVVKVTAYLKYLKNGVSKLLQNTYRISYPVCRMVPLSMTLIGFWLGFQGHNIFWLWISQKRHEVGSHRLSIKWCHSQWPSLTLNPVFKVTAFLKSNVSKTASLGQIFYRTLIGNHKQSIEWYQMFSNSMTLSDLWPGFQGHDIFWSRISEKRCVLKTKLLLHKRKLYLTYGTVLCLVTLTDL